MERRTRVKNVVSSALLLALIGVCTAQGEGACGSNQIPVEDVDWKSVPRSLYLQVYSTSTPHKPGPVLQDGALICPESYPSGFTIYCKGMQESAKFVTFYVDGTEVRKEVLAPYVLTGDIAGKPKPWENAPDSAEGTTIRCSTDTGQSVQVSVKLSCGTVSPSTRKPEATIPTSTAQPLRGSTPSGELYLELVKANVNSGSSLRKVNGQLSFCPSNYPDGVSFLCEGYNSNTNYVVFKVNGRHVWRENKAPYAIRGNSGALNYAWTGYPQNVDEFTLSCETDKGQVASAVVKFNC